MVRQAKTLKCPNCGHERSQVTDSRGDGKRVYRRRQCLVCRERYSTAEVIVRGSHTVFARAIDALFK